jgi:uncharacterized protein
MIADILASLSGALVGLVLGVVGGGGSILAVPLLVYAVGVASPHVAIGTSALAVSASALANLAGALRQGRVKWRCGVVFAGAGVAGAFAGSAAAKAMNGEKLLALFGALMIAVGVIMFLRRKAEGDEQVRLDATTARRLVPFLSITGFGTGLLSGFFGIGGGFLIVPALMLATGMPLAFATGTSLVAVSAFGAATAASYAWSGLVDWRVAGLFIAGGVLGSLGGAPLGRLLGSRKGLLGAVFAGIVVLVGTYVVYRGYGALV